MSEIQYAIQIETNTAVTNASYGINSGTIRLITGRPGYDGNPVYPLWEDGTNNTNVWYEGLLIEAGGISRSIELTVAGNYGSIQGASLKIANDSVPGGRQPYWKFLNDNDIFLNNRTLTIYAVIDGVFYSIFYGVVGDVKYDDIYLYISGDSIIKTKHKEIPVNLITETNYGEAPDVSSSDAVPVCIGDVLYARGYPISSLPEFQTLTYSYGEYRIWAGAYQYDPTIVSTVDGETVYTSRIRLWTKGVNIAEDAFKGYYLFTSEETEGSSASPAENLVYRISHNDATIVNGGREVTDIYIETCLQKKFGEIVTIAEFNEVISVFSDNEDAGNRWWFRIAKLDVSYKFSEGPIKSFYLNEKNRPVFRQYPTSGSIDFFDISKYVSGTNTSNSTLECILPSLLGGNIVYYSYITPDIKTFFYDRFTNLYDGVYADVYDFSKLDKILTDHNRDTYAHYTSIIKSRYYYLNFRLTWKETETLDDYDNLYICYDITENLGVTQSMQYFFSVYNLYGDYIIKDLPGSALVVLNGEKEYTFLPNRYYAGGNYGSLPSDFGKAYFGGSSSQAPRVKLLIPSSVIDALKNVGSVGIIEVKLRMANNDPAVSGPFGPVYLADYYLRQVGIVGEKVINVTSDPVFSSVKGELIDGEETNNVYNAFRLMLETYDGIDNSLIDYGNLPTTRSSWFVGRQLTEKKSSFDYLKELAAQSFVAIYPTRGSDSTGAEKILKLTSWRDNTTSLYTHNDQNIIRDSFKNLDSSRVSDVSNVIDVKYSYNPATSKFDRSYYVANIDQNSFPDINTDSDGDGKKDWQEYFGGLKNTSYADAKYLWSLCHAAYTRIAVSNNLPEKYGNSYWYNDRSLFNGQETEGLGTDSSAFKYFQNLCEWATQKKDFAKYSIPVTSDNIKIDLTDRVTVNDVVLTNGTDRGGWVTKINFNTEKNVIDIETMLDPINPIETADIIKEVGFGNTNDTTTEVGSGNTLDTIEEQGVI